MADDRSSPRAGLPRRRFLGALAVAPAALASCATASTSGSGSAGAPRAGATGVHAPAPAPDAATRAVREQPLAAEAEPAFVFRAGAVRPGEP